MLKTFKKMILHTKDDELDKPNVREEPRESDYRIPEPEDIRRLPPPAPAREFQERPLENRAPPSFNEFNREPPLQRPPATPFPEPRPAPAPRPSIEEQIRNIMYRLDDLERRVARLEGMYPPPRRY